MFSIKSAFSWVITRSKNWGLKPNEFLLVFISCLLLAVWAMKGTIALRNILISLGFISALIYFYGTYKNHQKINNPNPGLTVFQWLPLCFVASMFLWVLFHYFTFSQEPQQQLQELKSTWLRSFFVTVIGLALGQIIVKKPTIIFFLGLSLASNFAVLLYQYLPKALNTNQLFVPMFYESIFRGKINAVLVGVMSITFLLSSTIYLINTAAVTYPRKNYFISGVICCIALILFSFSYIIDTRNGMGISGIVILIFLVLSLWPNRFKAHTGIYKKRLIFSIISFILFGFIFSAHLKNNLGWHHYIEDIRISAQIDRYPQWQKIDNNYPRTASGREVAGNTYERTAWAVAGFQILLDQPFGYGLLSISFGKWLKQINPEATAKSTHSAWLDLAMAFGWPALFFSAGSLVVIILGQYQQKSLQQTSLVLICLAILILWLLGELNAKHSVEFLYFCIAIACSMNASKTFHA